MNWEYDGCQTQWEAYAGPFTWRVHVLKDGTFTLEYSSYELNPHVSPFQTLQAAKDFCESQESGAKPAPLIVSEESHKVEPNVVDAWFSKHGRVNTVVWKEKAATTAEVERVNQVIKTN